MNKQKALLQLKELKKHAHPDMRLAAENWSKPWQSLVSTMLSARTRDEVTIVVCNKLFKKYKTPYALARAPLKDVQKMIYSVNFYKNKSKNIKHCAQILAAQYRGNPPHNFEKLIHLPGVGRKTANVFLSEMGKSTIGVDTHVFYISRKLGWTKSKNPEQIEEDIKTLFDKKYWRSVNPTLVRFGRTHQSRRLKNALLDKIKKIA